MASFSSFSLSTSSCFALASVFAFAFALAFVCGFAVAFALPEAVDCISGGLKISSLLTKEVLSLFLVLSLPVMLEMLVAEEEEEEEEEEQPDVSGHPSTLSSPISVAQPTAANSAGSQTLVSSKCAVQGAPSGGVAAAVQAWEAAEANADDSTSSSDSSSSDSSSDSSSNAKSEDRDRKPAARQGVHSATTTTTSSSSTVSNSSSSRTAPSRAAGLSRRDRMKARLQLPSRSSSSSNMLRSSQLRLSSSNPAAPSVPALCSPQITPLTSSSLSSPSAAVSSLSASVKGAGLTLLEEVASFRREIAQTEIQGEKARTPDFGNSSSSNQVNLLRQSRHTNRERNTPNSTPAHDSNYVSKSNSTNHVNRFNTHTPSGAVGSKPLSYAAVLRSSNIQKQTNPIGPKS
mmetsp:Transcript_14118/g.27422  ORF Transcript_14118/g.27422 Transcript_14118/m.27422 type:complete len:403 (-) Transcript_14118:7-1215(-)